MKYIATISGGKDSVTMCDLLLKNGYPVDYIIFQDTLMEFDLMYHYIEKLKSYFKNRYKKEIIVTKPRTTFEHWCYGVINDKTSKFDGCIRGIPMVWSEPCYWRREAKVKPSEELIESLIGCYGERKIYIGYTLDERTRIQKDEKLLYPLITEFKMTERDCKHYLINEEMENPLYKFFNRTGCGMCPGQSEKAWYQVWKNFKDMWTYMVLVENRLDQLEKSGIGIKNKYWFTKFRTCADMEKLFKKMEKQGSLFELSDEPLKDCFCKI
ncbi:phosphoadenosine phosphosulfate reductase family protein [Sulfurospirillum sp. UCH001]|uniref:phosphoadenosine phosphosulfate reductase domain-containing protein n=1 Tax=Sulfurospirillum sp. UCH001 TaxID=1581011 RepID=UPI000830D1B2|nr:phosphoadenosine phosphosulfate reductase family protein [Sulfurospirillum sp. UCH001]